MWPDGCISLLVADKSCMYFISVCIAIHAGFQRMRGSWLLSIIIFSISNGNLHMLVAEELLSNLLQFVPDGSRIYTA